MKEHPILFSAPMVRAILKGVKTQTRRVINLCNAPFQVGQIRWTRETWAVSAAYDYLKPSLLTAHCGTVQFRAGGGKLYDQVLTETCFEADGELGKWRPSIFMPRWASRITLEIVSVRVERLQEISESDAKAEGIFEFGSLGFYGYDKNGTPGKHCFDTARETYAALWDKINGKRKGCAWADSPWVWRIEFKRLKP